MLDQFCYCFIISHFTSQRNRQLAIQIAKLLDVLAIYSIFQSLFNDWKSVFKCSVNKIKLYTESIYLNLDLNLSFGLNYASGLRPLKGAGIHYVFGLSTIRPSIDMPRIPRSHERNLKINMEYLQHDYMLTGTAFQPFILCLSCNK